MSQIATVVFVLGILGLFVLDRDSNAMTSKAIWLPVAWLLIAGSRPVSTWLHMAPPDSLGQYLEGSPLDRNIYLILLIAGIIVLLTRRAAVEELLRTNTPILLFVFYCAVSISWSDYPDIAFKRWIKSLGDFAMILIVLTDPDRSRAVKRVLTRVGFVLLPLSVLFIKYYPELGRAYGAWDGKAFYVGVATDKNMLGKACLVFGLASTWLFLQEISGARKFKALIVHGSILAITVWLLWLANSMTSLSCFLIASGLLAANSHLRIARKPAVLHLLVTAALAISFSAVFLDLGRFLLDTMGRDPTLTGRTELWDQLIGMIVNPVLGTGFESFWLGQRLERLWAIYWWHPNESHNGYLELFLNLGCVGVILLAVLMVAGYRNVVRLLNSDPEAGRLRLAYFVVGVSYNFTEAAFRTLDPLWIAFILAVIGLPEVSSRTSPAVRASCEKGLVTTSSVGDHYPGARRLELD